VPISSFVRTETFVTNDGVSIAYRDNGGDGIPLVMLHGWLQSQDAFHFQLDGLNPRRVVTLDFRGHGESGHPEYGFRIARLAADIRDFLDHLQLAQVDALGWSLGASVWWSFIDVFGSTRLRKLVIVDKPAAIARMPWMSDDDATERGTIWDLPLLAQIVESVCVGGSGETIAGIVTESRDRHVDESAIEVLVDGMRRADAFQVGKLLFDHSTQDWADVLPRIDVPTLVVGCEGSHVPTQSQRSSARSIPGGQVHIFPSELANSHFPFLQNPTAFNTVLEAFLH
jgi:pimeloyl-ACP methyl ester carboxylesterase